MIERLNDYDWQEAFEYANPYPAVPGGDVGTSPFFREDVVEIAGAEEGLNDGEEWRIYGRLGDGRWFYLEAWCDYTGWDCQAGGDAWVAGTRQEIEKFGLTRSARLVFGVPEP